MDREELLGIIAATQKLGLTALDLSNKSIDKLPSEIGELTQLVELNLSENHLVALPVEIGRLASLKHLDISENRLERLPEGIGELSELIVLDAANCRLAALPPEIGRLVKLTRLNLSGNQLSSLPAEIGRLSRLEHLQLTANKVRVFPPELGALANLRVLEFYGNLLTVLPPEIGNLTRLEALFLSGNPLTALPPEIGSLRNLKSIHLKHNKIRKLPREIAALDLQEIRVDGNPLRFPPVEIAAQGFAEIKDYIASIINGDSRQRMLYEAKLMILGQGGVGKTSIVNRLLFDFYDDREQATTGIEIEAWDRQVSEPPITVNEWSSPVSEDQAAVVRIYVWDFGGQEIYSPTHQFFLTERSVYLLVADSRMGSEVSQLYYWLHRIESFAEHSPVLLVLNKCDVAVQDINLKDLRRRFPQIQGLFQISCKEPQVGRHSFDALRDTITKIALEILEGGTPWSESWLNVRKAIRADTRRYMPLVDYLNLCERYDISRKEGLVLSRYMHELGVVLHFQEIEGLRDILVLDPAWVTNAVYLILNEQTIKAQGGVLHYEDLPSIWECDVYPESIYPTLLTLLNRFELAYEIVPGKDYLVPALLPNIEIETDLDDENALQFYYQYDFLPPSVMTRFIVIAHRDLEEDARGQPLCWREGAVLRWEKARALVRMRKMEQVVEIKVEGMRQREMLAVIRHQFDQVHRSIRGVGVSQQVPCCCSPECQNRFNYDGLLEAERKRKETVECQTSWNDVSLSLLLDGYERKENRATLHARQLGSSPAHWISVHDEATVVLGSEQSVALSRKGDYVKQEKVIQIGDKASVSAPVVVADTIESSFNTLTKSDIGDNLKTLLDQLLRAVNDVNKQVPPEDSDVANEMARDADTLVKEATSPNPRRKWYEVSLEGLKQAAINIGEIADPVLDIVKKLVPLLLP